MEYLDHVDPNTPRLYSMDPEEKAEDYDDRLIQFYLPYSLGGGQADVTALSA
jgi:hypothetical protein